MTMRLNEDGVLLAPEQFKIACDRQASRADRTDGLHRLKARRRAYLARLHEEAYQRRVAAGERILVE